MNYREVIEAVKNGDKDPNKIQFLIDIWPKVSFGEQRLINELVGNVKGDGKSKWQYFTDPRGENA